MKAHNLILRQARRSVGPDLTLPQFDVMAQLAREPDGLTPAVLSRRLLVTAGNMTGIVERLVREGLVRRDAHESDGRARSLTLTPSGRRLMSRALPRHARDIEALFDRLPKGDVKRLRDLLSRLAQALEKEPGHEEAR